MFDTAPRSAALTGPEGNTIKVNRIHRLSDAKVEDFRQLLRILYPRRFDDEELSTREWLSVLNLSTLWGFGKVRTKAIKHLDVIPVNGIKGALELFVLSQKHDVKDWLLRALRVLAVKNEFKESFTDLIGTAMSFRIICLQGMVAGVRWEKEAKGAKEEVTQDEIDGLIKKIFPEVDSLEDTAATDEKKSEMQK